MSKIISLDNALQNTGWAIFENNKPIHNGIFKTKNSATIEKRLGEYWQHLTDLYYEYEFEKLIFEDCQQQANSQTYSKLSMVKATILLWCYFNDMPYEIFSPSSWRSITGGGYGKKREEQKSAAIAKVKEWYKLDVSSDIADAICIGRAAILSKNTNKSAF